MKPNYKNWVPEYLLYLLAFFAVFGVGATFFVQSTLSNGTLKTTLTVVFLVGGAVSTGVCVWMTRMYRAFSYNGTRQLAREIVEGTAAYVTAPENGAILDVGCGSGALTIAVAKKNPTAKVTGVDRWGLEYSNYNRKLCENNAKAEGVHNVQFSAGDAVKLDFPDESFDAVTSNYVYHNINGVDRQQLLLETLRLIKKGGTFAIHDIFSKSKYGDMQAFIKRLKAMGYEEVCLIDTTDGKFMTKNEATLYSLRGSAILYGKK